MVKLSSGPDAFSGRRRSPPPPPSGDSFQLSDRSAACVRFATWVTVLRLSAPVTGIAMTVGVVAGLVCMPAVNRWLDRGARSTVVAASMLVRVLGVALLLAGPAGHV